MNLPNFLTIIRMLLVPVMVWLIIDGQFRPALAVFGLAALTDALDGWLARQLGLQTAVGAHLDPLADKLLLVTCYAVLGIFKLVPAWLVIAVISRDVLIVGGLMLSWFMNNPLQVRPLLVSKANTLGQILYLVLALAEPAFDSVKPWILEVSAYGVAALTGISGFAYLRTWFDHMGRGTA